MCESRIIVLQDDIDAARARLASFPNGPPEWRAKDEALIARNVEKIERIRKEAKC
jgi:hypothetical protein